MRFPYLSLANRVEYRLYISIAIRITPAFFIREKDWDQIANAGTRGQTGFYMCILDDAVYGVQQLFDPPSGGQPA